MNSGKRRAEVERLANAAAGDWCPGGGWQFPFDFGDGIVARTYSPTQAELHPWRRNIMLAELDAIYAGRYDGLSVLDLGAGEGAMALALWQRGVRDITCVEVRPTNVEKAKFVFGHFGVDARIVEADVEAYLAAETRRYDVVLFMGLLYHLISPFPVLKRIGEMAGDAMVIETVLALPTPVSFANDPQYSPTPAGFFIRRDSAASHTAGTIDLELWPTPEGFFDLLRHGGFSTFKKAEYGPNPPHYFATNQRILGIARKPRET